jgi:hypothetical protein
MNDVTKVEEVEAILDDKDVLVKYAVVGVIVKVLVNKLEDDDPANDSWSYYTEEDLVDSSLERVTQMGGKVLLVCEDLKDAEQCRENLVNVV